MLPANTDRGMFMLADVSVIRRVHTQGVDFRVNLNGSASCAKKREQVGRGLRYAVSRHVSNQQHYSCV